MQHRIPSTTQFLEGILVVILLTIFVYSHGDLISSADERAGCRPQKHVICFCVMFIDPFFNVFVYFHSLSISIFLVFSQFCIRSSSAVIEILIVTFFFSLAGIAKDGGAAPFGHWQDARREWRTHPRHQQTLQVTKTKQTKNGKEKANEAIKKES